MFVNVGVVCVRCNSHKLTVKVVNSIYNLAKITQSMRLAKRRRNEKKKKIKTKRGIGFIEYRVLQVLVICNM